MEEEKEEIKWRDLWGSGGREGAETLGFSRKFSHRTRRTIGANLFVD